MTWFENEDETEPTINIVGFGTLQLEDGRNVPGRYPIPASLTWAELAASLSIPRSATCTAGTCAHKDCLYKQDGRSWSPAIYRTGTTRGRLNVEAVTAFVIDIDHVKPDAFEATLAAFAPLRAVVHASHSDVPGDRCLRAVVALSHPVASEDWPRFWTTATAALGVGADPATRDASRVYYTPSRPSDACVSARDGTGYLYTVIDGQPLDVDLVLASAPPVTPPGAQAARSPRLVPMVSDVSPENFDAAVELLGDAWPANGRNAAQLVLAGALAHSGWEVDDIAEFCAAVAEHQQPGNGMLHKRRAAARSSVDKVQRDAHVTGWPTLEAEIDPDIIRRVRALLGIKNEPPVDPDFDEYWVEEEARAPIPPTPAQAADRVAASVPPMPAPSVALMPYVSRGDEQATVTEIRASLESVRKRLKNRKDVESIHTVMLISRVLGGKLLADAGDDTVRVVTQTAIAIARAALSEHANVTAMQIQQLLMPCVTGDIGDRLPTIVAGALQQASQMSSITALPQRADLELEDISEFKLATQGPGAGLPLSSDISNFRLAFTKIGVQFREDLFASRDLIYRNATPPQPFSDKAINQLMFECEERFAFCPPKEKFFDYCSEVARRNAFHPVREYLDALPAHDGVSRCETWLIDYAGAEDTPLNRAISRLILVAAVRRVRQPGCKFDEMLILESEQGSLKSSGLRALCPNIEWFTDESPLGLDTRKQMEITDGKWIVEAGELRGSTSKDVRENKAYLSRSQDEARKAYGRLSERHPRQFVIIATTNDDQYLTDPTGERRYWPVAVRQFDVKRLGAIRDQLWAEANALDAANPDSSYIRLDPSLYAAAAIEQGKRRVVDFIELRLSQIFGNVNGRILTEDVFRLAGFDGDKVPSVAEQKSVTCAMTALKFRHRQVRFGGERKRPYYSRGTEAEQECDIKVSGNSVTGWILATTVPAGNPETAN